MRQINHLKKIATEYLNNNISADEFGRTFEGYFYNHEDKIYEVNKGAYNVLDNIREAINLFEPDENVRQEDADFISERELRNQVKEYIGRI